MILSYQHERMTVFTDLTDTSLPDLRIHFHSFYFFFFTAMIKIQSANCLPFFLPISIQNARNDFLLFANETMTGGTLTAD